jgi:hypothetical protein
MSLGHLIKTALITTTFVLVTVFVLNMIPFTKPLVRTIFSS